MSNWNSKVIEEFRANDGKVGENFENVPLLLLHHTGAKSELAVSPNHVVPSGRPWRLGVSTPPSPKEDPDEAAR